MSAGGRQGILSLTIKDKGALYAAYMPFIKNGGLFIPTNKPYKLGDEVFMLLNRREYPSWLALWNGVEFPQQLSCAHIVATDVASRHPA